MSELKPCPCCEGEAKLLTRLTAHAPRVYCTECRLNTGGCETEEEAVEKWNRRATIQVERHERGDFLQEVHDWAYSGLEGCDGNEYELFIAILEAIARYRVNAGLVEIVTCPFKDSPEASNADDLRR